MINFDSSHQSVEENLKKKKGKKIATKVLAAGLIAVNLVAFSGYVKAEHCEIDKDHAHYYINEENNMGRYIISEKSTIDGLTRTDQYVSVSEKQESLLRFINRNGLFRIDENREAIKAIENSNQDYIEYEYQDYTLRPMPRVLGNNPGGSFHFVPMPKKNWTTNPNERNLTGKTRTIHYVYYGYKIIQNENGSYKLERSPYVDRISDLPEEYEYVSTNFSTRIDLENHMGIDYEPSAEMDLHEEDLEYMQFGEQTSLEGPERTL